VDVLSEVLKTVYLNGAVYFNARFSSPWRVVSPPSASVAPVFGTKAEHLIIYHLITEGRAYACLQGDKPVALVAGDLLVFPHGDAHLLGNGSPDSDLDAAKLLPQVLAQKLKETSLGGGGEITRIICGYMGCDRLTMQPLLTCLPPLLKISIRNSDFGKWLEDSIRFSVREAEISAAGSEAVLARLSEVLFLEAIRRFVDVLPAEEKGWLAGARDAVVGHSLMLLHGAPMHPWTIADLAKKVGVSRSALAERFTYYLGEPPMKYLADWRMRLAAKSLVTTSRSILEIAVEVGYDSEAAFCRAFKRQYGTPPAQYRKATRAARVQFEEQKQSAGSR
jgi:AraC-like DNA-binding protein